MAMGDVIIVYVYWRESFLQLDDKKHKYDTSSIFALINPQQARDPDCLEMHQERRPEIDMSQKLNQPSKLKLAKLERMLLKKKKGAPQKMKN